MENALVLMTLESFAAWLLATIITFITFWIYNNIGFVQRVILPGRDEAEDVDAHLTDMAVSEWRAGREWSGFYSLSVRDAARIIAAAVYYYAVLQMISPLF